ncbi:hypothetical protein QN224_24370 [Sinorhizobium sp. 8-89]|uniref:hypothetical protein n=1 Tax=Sinorhizobium sp. 7-81 TaxID=3049087 RepID=UPI0024C2D9AD|nr:hypothetical protein [Sinorhizobium sp. 7-81]MDK1388549.1 hypothetical protein [Sinorhizobium sp. 7-81]
MSASGAVSTFGMLVRSSALRGCRDDALCDRTRGAVILAIVKGAGSSSRCAPSPGPAPRGGHLYKSDAFAEVALRP